MMTRSRAALSTVLRIAFAVAAFALALPAAAQPHGGAPLCPAPIQTCGGADEESCPQGYQCVCVPSCPLCRDCAARVCIETEEPKCRTACDCSPGLGCFDGQCIAGFAPVYCCDANLCPSNEQCESRRGEMGRCDDRCERTRELAATKIDRIVRLAGRCSRDEQCVRVDTWTDCQGTCGAWVNQRYAPLVRRAVRYVDARVCGDYEGCPFAAPRCAAETGVCREGRCAGTIPNVPGTR